MAVAAAFAIELRIDPLHGFERDRVVHLASLRRWPPRA
ncbi:hypothetical protein GGR44_001854 [Sphingobium fontiphilum]|uniref:Uncharacterized protein n=1 Tax=Sphingobium fontiphilum TaxID=944425 RepID=A0A7W6DF88_9SPHN|nr:hypothetical protein [Sphingobium fontiphilum]